LDVDSLVEVLLGKEGVPRYKRLGIVLIVVSLILMVTFLAAPIIKTEEESYSYFRMQDDREVWEDILEKANMSLIALALLALFGMLLLLEGQRRISLRKLMPWHAEARATALYAIGTVIAFVGVIGMAAIWGMTLNLEEAVVDGEEQTEEMSSPAGAIVTLFGILVILGLLALVAYSVTLSSYRGGLDPQARAIGRIAVLVAFAALLGVIVLRLGSVIVVESSYETFVTYEGTDPMTYFEIDFWAHVPEADSEVERFDAYLDVISWCLFLSALLALAGTVGISAFGLGARSRRVYLGVALPILALLLGFVAFGVTALAATQVGDVAEGLYPWSGAVLNFEVQGNVGAGLGLCLIMGALVGVLSLFYFRNTGRPVVLTAIGTIPPAVEEGVVEVPVTGEAPEAPPAPAMAKRSVQWIILAVIVVIAVSAVALLMMRGGGGGDGDDGNGGFDYDSLEDITWSSGPISDYLGEGTASEPNSFPYDIEPFLNAEYDGVVLIEEVTATLTWQDEPDRRELGRIRVNHPDNFQIEIVVDGNSTVTSSITANDISSKQGTIDPIVLNASMLGFRYLADENWLGAYDLPQEELGYVVTEIWVNLYEAEDLQADGPAALLWIDGGNNYTLEITVRGKLYVPEET
jgi:flagellar basal body-associated protein FliL